VAGKGVEGSWENFTTESAEETERGVAEEGIGSARQGTREEAEGFQRAAARVPGGAWAPPVAGLGLSAAQKGKLCTRWRTELSLISKCGAMVKGKARGIGGVNGTKVPWAQLAAFREGRAGVTGWPFLGRCPVFLTGSIFNERVGPVAPIQAARWLKSVDGCRPTRGISSTERLVALAKRNAIH